MVEEVALKYYINTWKKKKIINELWAHSHSATAQLTDESYRPSEE